MEQEQDTSYVVDVLQEVIHLLNADPRLQAHTTASGAPPILPASISDNPPIHRGIADEPSSRAEILDHLSKDILPLLNLSSLSPNYYGFVTGGATPAALLGDILTSIYDQNVAVHLPRQTISTDVENAALNKLVNLFHLETNTWGLPGPRETHFSKKGKGGAGTFTTGATASNVLGLALGREFVLNGSTGMSVGEYGLVECMRAADVPFVKVLSTMPHSSMAKAASIVGLGRASVISIASTEDALKIDMVKLRAEIGQAGGKGRYILAISAGEVNTGRFATDSWKQMKELRDICDEFGIWMHVDGAFGLFCRVLMEYDSQWPGKYDDIVKGVQGLELADSITGDGHKLLNVPYDCGFFLTRHRGLSEKVFQNGNAAYLSSGVGSADEKPSPLNVGIENSRRFRALPVYITLSRYARAGYRDMLMRQIDLARKVASWLFDHPAFELLPAGESREIMVAKTFMIVLFRAKSGSKNEDLVQKINATDKIYVTGTSWDGRPAARIAISNWRTDVERDSQQIFEALESVVSA